MGSDVAIRVEGLWKQYGLSTGSMWSHVERVVPPWMRRCLRGEDTQTPWALRDVSFEVRQGETLGIIGRNGAGKSTLLKVLAGVTKPTKGRVEVRGQVFPMIELNAGLHLELTGRENVFLLGAIMGLSRRKIEAILPDVEEFVELGEWFDRPARTYSSGMLARLGFGVATSIRSEILLIDETFSIGDLKFQNKSLARVKQMREQGATVLLVTHSLDMLQFVAQRGLVLEGGTVLTVGSVLDGLNAYERLVHGLEQENFGGRQARRRTSGGTITISSAKVIRQDGGEAMGKVDAGVPFGIEVSMQFERAVERCVFSVGIVNSAGVLCVWNTSDEDAITPRCAQGACRLRVWFLQNALSNGAYEIHLSIRNGDSFETLERLAGLANFTVVGPGRARGIVAMPSRWEISEESVVSSCNVANAMGNKVTQHGNAG